LSTRNLPELLAWAGGDSRAIPILISLLFETGDLPRWRAIEALGRVAGDRADTDPESIRNLLRQLLWCMNDESGNIIWCAAEAIGEILAHAPVLIDEYARLLPAYLVEEPFERGAHWAVARVAGIRPEVFREREEELARSLPDPDPFIRAHAALALIRIEGGVRREEVRALLGDMAPVTVYDVSTGDLKKTTVQAILESG